MSISTITEPETTSTRDGTVGSHTSIMIAIQGCKLSTAVVPHRNPRCSRISTDGQRVDFRGITNRKTGIFSKVPCESPVLLQVETNFAIALRQFVHSVQADPVLRTRISKPLFVIRQWTIEKHHCRTSDVIPQNQYWRICVIKNKLVGASTSR